MFVSFRQYLPEKKNDRDHIRGGQIYSTRGRDRAGRRNIAATLVAIRNGKRKLAVCFAKSCGGGTDTNVTS
jgi:hypothetical protein